MSEQDPRIGTLATDGSPVVWPSVDVTGARYSKPATRHKLNATQFVVLPGGFDNWALLNDVKASLNPAPAVEAVEEAAAEEAAPGEVDDSSSARRRSK